MSTGKLVLYMTAWVVASVMIAVVIAILAVEVVRLFGGAESGSTGYAVVLNGVFLIVLVALLAIPFVFRRRFNAYEPPPETRDP